MYNTNLSNSCNYTTLSHYNAVTPGTMQHASASSSPVDNQGVYVVPVWGAPGYNSLTHGNQAPTCIGHFNISQAYGANAANCNTRFVQRLCSENIGQ